MFCIQIHIQRYLTKQKIYEKKIISSRMNQSRKTFSMQEEKINKIYFLR